MVKKILFGSLVLHCLLFSTMGGKCFADASAQLEQAQNLKNSGQYEQAEEIFQDIIRDYPGTKYALKAEQELTMVYIKCGKDMQAWEALDRLFTGFPGDPNLPAALYSIATTYTKAKRYEEAKSLYQYIIQQYPYSPYANRAELNIPETDVFYLIESGNDVEAQVAIDKLFANFSGHVDLPAALHRIARRYEGQGKYEQSKNLYKQIIQQHPDSPYAGSAQLDIPKGQILSFIDTGDDSKALAATDTLIVDFNDHPDLSLAILRIAEQYYTKAYRLENEALTAEAKDRFTKALTVWEEIITELPESGITAEAYLFSGHCCNRLGEYEKAIEYYKEAANRPDYEYAWHALFLVGRTYENLKMSGVISKSEADPKTKAAYKQVLEKYPTYKAAKHARRWLIRYNSKIKGESR